MKRRWLTAGESPTRGTGFAPPGSNRSGGGGNETVGASGVEGHLGDLASMQAVTGVNAEQASIALGKSGGGESGAEPVKPSEFNRAGANPA